MIVVVECWASFYRIYDRQNVLASDISSNRPIQTSISMIEKQINLLEKESSHFWPIFIAHFRHMNVFNWGVSHFEKWSFSNSNIFIRMFTAGIVNLVLYCECKKADEQIFDNRIESDRSEAEKYEFTHEFFFFSIYFFST